MLVGQYLTFTGNLAIGGSSNGSGVSQGEKADAQGGGIGIQISSSAEFDFLTISGNQALGGSAPNGNSGGAFGGGLFAEDAFLTIRDSVVSNNLAQGGAGANHTSDPFSMGGGIAAHNTQLLVARVQVINNLVKGGNSVARAGAASGGGIGLMRFTGNSTVTIRNTVIADNRAEMGTGPDRSGSGGGGGLYLHGTNATLTHITLARNQLQGPPMEGLAMIVLAYMTPTSSVATLSHSIVAQHNTYSGEAAIRVHGNSSLTINRALFDNNSENFDGPGSVSGTNTITYGSARFAAPGSPNFDYHLKVNSDARGKAIGSQLNVDIDNETRDGNRDLGADEYVPKLPTIGSFQGFPVASGAIQLQWSGANMPPSYHYDVMVSCANGARRPNEVNCNTVLNVGTALQLKLTGMDNGRAYGIVVTARDASNNVLTNANMSVTPTDIFLYLPAIRID